MESQTPISDGIRFRSRATGHAARAQELGASRAETIATLMAGYGLDAKRAERVADHAHDKLKAHGWPGRERHHAPRGPRGQFTAAEAPPAPETAAEETTLGGFFDDEVIRRVGQAAADSWGKVSAEARARITAGLQSEDAEAVAAAWTDLLREPVRGLGGALENWVSAPPSAWQLQYLHVMYDRGRTVRAAIHYQHRAPLKPPAPVELVPPPAPDDSGQ